ncbi:nucleotidyltransferase domain-containing protein [Micromonospora echinofusca]|uniref:nucleotidyltransferase domain-containing protein n=1 Tax=Micromonospora echinofusca TaxID=47858 RepID=UPI001AD6F8DC|nr:nucleotidyltransferase domain-containing protein [Micromonospora echinofusca]
MPAAPQLIARIADVLAAEPRVVAAWLYGSHGRGVADAYSDVDVLVAAEDPEGLRADWPVLADRIGPTVLVEPIAGFPAVRHVMPDWARYDVHFVTPAEVRQRGREGLVPLVDRGGLHDRLDAGTRPVAVDPARVHGLAVEFAKVLGQLPAVLHRADPVYAATWSSMLRLIGIEWLLACHPVTAPGGASRQYATLPTGLRAALADLPPIAADLSGTRAVAVACARLFPPVARRVAADAFPAELYAALDRMLRRELDLPVWNDRA